MGNFLLQLFRIDATLYGTGTSGRNMAYMAHFLRDDNLRHGQMLSGLLSVWYVYGSNRFATMKIT